jgi:hypothetical protein
MGTVPRAAMPGGGHSEHRGERRRRAAEPNGDAAVYEARGGSNLAKPHEPADTCQAGHNQECAGRAAGTRPVYDVLTLAAGAAV